MYPWHSLQLLLLKIPLSLAALLEGEWIAGGFAIPGPFAWQVWKLALIESGNVCCQRASQSCVERSSTGEGASKDALMFSKKGTLLLVSSGFEGCYTTCVLVYDLHHYTYEVDCVFKLPINIQVWLSLERYALRGKIKGPAIWLQMTY